MNKTIYTKDASQKKLTVERRFDAPVALVWRAWTESEILDQWWAPKPWKTETKSMDFRAGGHWLYSMNGPEGERHWARMDYKRVVPQKMYDSLDGFCDETGKMNHEAPVLDWAVSFSPSGNATNVVVVSTFAKQEDLDTLIQMGFQEGFASAHENLDTVLKGMQASLKV
jgi:PhnB protein